MSGGPTPYVVIIVSYCMVFGHFLKGGLLLLCVQGQWMSDLLVEPLHMQVERGLARGIFSTCIFLLTYGAFQGIPGSLGAKRQKQAGVDRSRFEHRLR